MERVLVLIKPDATHKMLSGYILDQFINSDIKLRALKLVKPQPILAKKHYELLKDKFFFAEIVDYLTGKLHGGAPIVAMVFEGKGVVKRCREIAGATNPEEASPNSVRGKFGRITTKGLFENVVHVSSSDDEAEREIKLWFKASEIV